MKRTERNHITCVMVTKDRRERFAESFACYCRQDYGNRDMVIVTDGTPEYQAHMQRVVETSGRDDVAFVRAESGGPLGLLRNIALQAARGPLVCQWDDDDLSHPERLSTQLRYLLSEGARVSYLVEQLQLFLDERRLYWSDWSRCKGDPYYIIPGSILAYKDVLPPYTSHLRRFEDAEMRNRLFESGVQIARLRDAGHLSIYMYHGKNVYEREHHMRIVRQRGLGVDELKCRAELIVNALGTYPLAPPLAICSAADEVVFEWNG